MHRQQQLRKISILSGLLFWFAPLTLTAQVVQDPPFGRPDAVVDLAARDSVQLVKGQWRYHDVKIVDADSRAVGPDLKPSGDPIKTYDYAPYAGAADFDDSQWEAIDATTLDQRRSTAKVCFNWYRILVQSAKFHLDQIGDVRFLQGAESCDQRNAGDNHPKRSCA